MYFWKHYPLLPISSRLPAWKLKKSAGYRAKPILFGTTEEFLRYFSLESLDDLPILNQETIETFKDEAEKEVMQELEEEQGE